MPARRSAHRESLMPAGPPSRLPQHLWAPQRPACPTAPLRPLPGAQAAALPPPDPGWRCALPSRAAVPAALETPDPPWGLSPEPEEHSAMASGGPGRHRGARVRSLLGRMTVGGLSDKPGAQGEAGWGWGRAARGGAGRGRACQHLGGGAAQGKAVGAGRSVGRVPKELSRLCAHCSQSPAQPGPSPAQPHGNLMSHPPAPADRQPHPGQLAPRTAFLLWAARP